MKIQIKLIILIITLIFVSVVFLVFQKKIQKEQSSLFSQLKINNTQVYSEDEAIKKLNDSINASFLYSLLFFIILLFAISGVVFLWIIYPLRNISMSLLKDDTSCLKNIRNKSNEFADIAMLIDEFHEQKKRLIREVEKNKNKELMLEELEGKFYTLFETSPSGILLLNTGAIITSVNKKIEEIFLYDKNELIGQNIEILMHDSYREKHRVYLKKALFRVDMKSMNSFGDNVLGKRKDGSEVYIHVSLGYTELKKENLCIVFINDITDIKKREAELNRLLKIIEGNMTELSVANAELSKASRLKDEFLANMSHELRTPLNGILNMSESLQEEIFGSLNEKQKKYLKNIEDSGKHLLSLINDILDLSKIEAGKIELEFTSVAVDTACQGALRLIKESAHKKSIKIQTSIDSDVDCIETDERRLKQILVNLLSNAVKFTQDGGRIGLDVSGNIEKEVIEFVVWDTGIGILEEDLERLFKPFVQLDSSLSRHYSGTGLGLVLVSRITDLLGGCVSVESEPGKGSKFTITLPWRHTQTDIRIVTAKEPLTASFDTNNGGKLILLVEDNDTNIKIYVNYLRSRNYRVMVAKNGKIALEMAKKHKPDIILMDMHMPVMDGFEATRELKKDPGLSSVPVIALTALAMVGDREKCIAAGASEYIAKPSSLKKLVEVIEEYLLKVRSEK